MATTLLGAIHATFTGDAALAAAFPQSPWLDEPKEGTDFPYCVVTELKEEEDLLDFEQEKKIVSTWDFVLYGEGMAEMEAHALTVRGLFDGLTATTEPPTAFAVSRRNLIRSTQVGYQVQLDQTRSSEARRVIEVRMSFYAEWEYA